MQKKRSFLSLILTIFILTQGGLFTHAASHGYTSSNIKGTNVRYVTLDMNDKSLKSMVLNANDKITSTEGLSQMAKKVDALAAINGTYFEAYEGTPVPWGTIIKDKKVLHTGNTGSIVGITEDNKLIIDNLKISFKGYINGKYRIIPWRINHPSTEDEAITIFTPEYKKEVKLKKGSKAVIVRDGLVKSITDKNFTCPKDGFVISYNPKVAYLVDERYEIGDQVEYEHEFKTVHTKPAEWEKVVNAIGAGPSLIINGKTTADGSKEGFWEAKINTNKASRTFIGATKSGKILMGVIPSATLKEAAAICKDLKLVNAMCLDGGGSTSLYYKSKGSITQGRKVNNGLAFVKSSSSKTSSSTSKTDKPSSRKEDPKIGVNINGSSLKLDKSTGRPYTDKNNRLQVPLKTTMEAIGADVKWNAQDQIATVKKGDTTIDVQIGKDYILVNGERVKNDTVAVVKDGKTYLPIKAVLRPLGYEIKWDGKKQIASVLASIK